jgi:DNA-binding MarR family transcriptional regulator
MDRLDALHERLATNQHRIMEHLAQQDRADSKTLSQQLGLTISDVERAVDHLLRMEPPLLNSLRASLFQLSPHARKIMGLAAPATTETSITDYGIAPGPRGRIVNALKAQPRSLKDIVKITQIKEAKVRWCLGTLKDRCLISAAPSPHDGRVMLYRLTTATPTEPPKPLLTPSITPLTDPSDWHTWAERLLLEGLGGPAVIPPTTDDAAPAPVETKSRTLLPRVLIVGAMPMDWRKSIEQEFSTLLRVDYFDDAYGGNGLYQRCRQNEHVFLRVIQSRHSHQSAIRSAAVPMTLVRGSLSQLRRALANFQQTVR